MRLDVNGIRRQDGSTKTMVFDPYFLIHHLSQFFVLEPGDLINTGTPPGVGMGMQPPTYLQPGDVMELGIDGLGTQRQTVAAPMSAASVGRKAVITGGCSGLAPLPASASVQTASRSITLDLVPRPMWWSTFPTWPRSQQPPTSSGRSTS